MHVFSESQRFSQWWLWVLVLISFSAVFYAPLKTYSNTGTFDEFKFGAGFWIGLGTFILLSVLLVSIRLDTEINKKGITYRFFPIQRKFKSILWTEMAKCFTRKYRPLSEYGGWGYRVGLGGGALNIKGNQGIQVHYKNGKNILLGTQKPGEAQKVIEKYFSK